MAIVHHTRILTCAGGHFVSTIGPSMYRGAIGGVAIESGRFLIYPEWLAEVRSNNAWMQVSPEPLRLDTRIWDFVDMVDHVVAHTPRGTNMHRFYPNHWTQLATHFHDVGWRIGTKKALALA